MVSKLQSGEFYFLKYLDALSLAKCLLLIRTLSELMFFVIFIKNVFFIIIIIIIKHQPSYFSFCVFCFDS